MNINALAKDLAGLKKELYSTSQALTAVYNELADTKQQSEHARAELKNIQTLKDPLLFNYEARIEESKKALVQLEADITAAVLTKEGMDEAMAERLETGNHAIANAIKVEHVTKESIKNLEHKEKSMLQTISNIQANQDQEKAQLEQLRSEVDALKQERDDLRNWLKSLEQLIELQQKLEIQEQEIVKGRDYLKAWEKEVVDYSHDLKVIEQRLMPEYIELYKTVTSKHIHAATYTKGA